jgi:hypothetical protein
MIDQVPGIQAVYYTEDEYSWTPLVIYGLMPMGRDRACPFMLGCEGLVDHPNALRRYTEVILGGWKQEYRHLFNWVHAENAVAIRWLKSLGFLMQDPAPYGARGELFRRFDWKRWVN